MGKRGHNAFEIGVSEIKLAVNVQTGRRHYVTTAHVHWWSFYGAGPQWQQHLQPHNVAISFKWDELRWRSGSTLLSGAQEACQRGWRSVHHRRCSRQLNLAGPPGQKHPPPILFLRGVINHRAPDRSSNGEESPWVELLACTLEDVHLLMIIFFSLYNHLFSHRHIHTEGLMQKAQHSSAVSPCPYLM